MVTCKQIFKTLIKCSLFWCKMAFLLFIVLHCFEGTEEFRSPARTKKALQLHDCHGGIGEGNAV